MDDARFAIMKYYFQGNFNIYAPYPYDLRCQTVGPNVDQEGEARKSFLVLWPSWFLERTQSIMQFTQGKQWQIRELQVTVICAKEQARQSESAKDCLV